MRHADAGDADPRCWPDDRDRPLTDAGRREHARVAEARPHLDQPARARSRDRRDHRPHLRRSPGPRADGSARRPRASGVDPRRALAGDRGHAPVRRARADAVRADRGADQP